MLARRGFRPTTGPLDLPFPQELQESLADRLAARLGHYGFRLFLRGAIQRPDGFAPAEATRYLTAAQARACAEALEELGLALRLGSDRYRLVHPARSFGGTLEWYVARELRRRLGFDVLAGLKFRQPGVGGDLDLVAAAEGRLYAVNAKPDLMANVARAVAEGLRAHSPWACRRSRRGRAATRGCGGVWRRGRTGLS